MEAIIQNSTFPLLLLLVAFLLLLFALAFWLVLNAGFNALAVLGLFPLFGIVAVLFSLFAPIVTNVLPFLGLRVPNFAVPLGDFALFGAFGAGRGFGFALGQCGIGQHKGQQHHGER